MYILCFLMSATELVAKKIHNSNTYQGKNIILGHTCIVQVTSEIKTECCRKDVKFSRFYFFNGPFPCYFVPLFQNNTLCKTFHTKMSLIFMKTSLKAEQIFI